MRHARSLTTGALALLLLASGEARAQEKDNDELVVPAKPAATTTPAPVPTPAPAAPPPPAPAPPAPRATDSSTTETSEVGQPAPAPAPSNDMTKLAELLAPYTVTGFLQSEYQSSQASEDQLAQGGVPLNKNRFTLRRARVRIDGDYKYAALQLEADGNTIRGPQIRILHAFGTLKLPGKEPKVPLVALTGGLFDTPYGYELTEWPRTRWFMERSTGSLTFFSVEPDLGAMLHGGISFLRYNVAVMNGNPADAFAQFGGLAPRAAKDVVVRIGAETHPREDLDVSGHVSAIAGTGFHPGTDATKGTVQWKDANEDGAIQPVELSGVPGVAVTPSVTFDRWSVGLDLQTRLRTGLGTTFLYGEVSVAKNMDRGLFLADPVLTGYDSRELSFYVGFVQEIGKYGVFGFRWDRYDPNANFFDKRGGRLVPTDIAIDTLSPMVGLVLPTLSGTTAGTTLTDRARLLFQYDFVRDKLARDDRGLPKDLKNDVLTLRLQVAL